MQSKPTKGRERSPRESNAQLSAIDKVPILRYGPESNFLRFKEAMSVAALERYGALGKLIELGSGYVKPPPNIEDYDLQDDPYGLKIEEYKADVKEYKRMMAEHEMNAPKLYATICNKLSAESMDEVRRHEAYEEFNREKDPVALWAAITELHQVPTTSKITAYVKKAARDEYHSIKQGPFESIVIYKQRFDAGWEAYRDLDNPPMDESDVAMDFMDGLDDARYADFKVGLTNDISRGAISLPTTVNEMYVLASRHLVVNKRAGGSSVGASFMTADRVKPTAKPQGPKGGTASRKSDTPPGSATPTSESATPAVANATEPAKVSHRNGPPDKRNLRCLSCNQKGHFARECPNREDPDAVHYTGAVLNTNRKNSKHGPNEVFIDNAAEVSVMHPKFLTGIRSSNGASIVGVGGSEKQTPKVGDLEGFFECYACEDCEANILSQADIEDRYSITYLPGKSYTVHMPNYDLVFERRGKFYVADMSDWVRSSEMVNITGGTDGTYTRRELDRAKRAMEFVKNAGYPSEKEAIRMVIDGNIMDIDLTAQDVIRGFRIFGKPPAAVRGKAKETTAVRRRPDDYLKQVGENQVLHADIMHIRGHHYLVAVAEPLQIIVTAAIESEKTERIGLALQSILEAIRGYGHNPVRVHLDPQPALQALVGKFPGVEVDISGAGDHVSKVDVRIKIIKEIVRSVQAGLPWNLPDDLIDDLVRYATTRLNARRTSASADSVAPKVALTGRRLSYRKEFGLSFGDYCEVRDNSCTSNDALANRTEPCIALYPVSNSTDSWMFYNINTKRHVKRSTWERMVTTDLIIRHMNDMAAKRVTESNENVPTTIDAPRAIPENEDTNNRGNETREESEDGISIELIDDEPAEIINPPPSEEGPRRSARVAAGVRRPVRYAHHTSLRKALRENGAASHKAIKSELSQLFKHKSALIPLRRESLTQAQLDRVIRSSMFLKTKFDATGAFEKVKARLVADGRMQDRSLYPDSSSPTVSMSSIATCLTIAAKEGAHAMKIDIGGAYLNANMTGETVIMELNKTLTHIAIEHLPELQPYVEDGKLLVKLDKALYGCVQSAKLWHDKLIGTLKQLGFRQNEVDPCVLTKTVDGARCILTVYVDDILALSTNKATLEWLATELRKVFDDVKAESASNFSYLGMHIKLENGKCTLSMENFTREVIAEYEAANTKTQPRNTPATSDLFNAVGAEELGARDKKIFHRTVAKLLYLAKRTRPDILTAVAYLNTRVKEPTTKDKSKLERVIGYLSATVDKHIVLGCKGIPRVVAYVDASFGNHYDGKSHTGAAVFIGQGCVLAVSRKQKVVTKDSTEAELVALSDMLTAIENCDELIRSLGYPNISRPLIFQDNKSTISLVTQGGGQPRTKHLRVKQYRIKERTDNKNVEITYLDTDRMLADGMTKAIQGDRFKGIFDRIMGTTKDQASVDRGALSGQEK